MTPLRRRLAALVMVLLVPAVGGCGMSGVGGSNYQTDQVYQPGVGINDRSGTVAVLGAVVVSADDGQGTFVASFANRDREKADTLTTVTGDQVEAKVSAPVKIESEALVNLADTGAISVTGDDVAAGKFVRLKLTFESGQTNSLNVPVVADNAEFADVTPAGPSASPSASASKSPTKGPSKSPSGTPSESPSASPTP